MRGDPPHHPGMDRRAFTSSLALGIFTLPGIVSPQPARKIPRIGIISLSTASSMLGPDPEAPSVNALLSGLRELGYTYGRDFITEPRGAEGKRERVSGLVAELVRLPVDVIVASGITLTTVRLATSTIPVVMAGSDDPVARGHVRSLARPGGNVTGLSNQGSETVGKRLQLLKEIVPKVATVAILWDRPSRPFWLAADAIARGRGWKLMSLEIHDGSDIEEAFKAATKARAGAMVVGAVSSISRQPQRVVELAASSRLPTMYEFRFYVEAGGLISYGADSVDLWRRAASFVDKILRGASPGDLPIEQPTKFELVINLKTAKALGLTIPPSLLARADQVIDP